MASREITPPDEATRDLREMWVVLFRDVLESQRRMGSAYSEEDKQFWRRTYTRAVFAAIEGACEMIKREAYLIESKPFRVITRIRYGKLSALAGETYSINENGEIEAQRLRTSFLQNMLFSLSSFQEAHGIKHRTRKDGDWPKVLMALKIRDRITHPKNKMGLRITDEELDTIVVAFHWFSQEFAKVALEKSEAESKSKKK